MAYLARGLAVAAALSVGGAVLAQSTGVELGGFTNRDPDAPVEITSDRLDLRREDGTALFSGDVVAVQGEMRLRAERVQVDYVVRPDGSLGDEVDSVTATGDVLLVTPSEAAESDEAVYYPARNEVFMTGNVLLTQGGNTVAGDRLHVDLETGTGEVEGRVRTVLQPGEESGQ